MTVGDDRVLRFPHERRVFARGVVRRWAWDEYLQELAAEEAMPERGPSRLDEVKAALLALDSRVETPGALGFIVWPRAIAARGIGRRNRPHPT